MIGTHVVNVAVPGEGLPSGFLTDISCLVDAVSIVHGRSDSGSQPAPSSATLDITIGPGAPLPPVVDIGAGLIVDTVVSGTAHRRFVGKITDVALGWDDAGEATPDSGVGQIVAVSVMADYARTVIGTEPFPQELDGARVARIFAAAGLTLAHSDPGTVQVIPRDVDARNALEVAHGTANSAGGLVWETTAGEIRYADTEHRRGAAKAMDLDACDLLVTPTWTRNLAGLVNEITMQYGVAPAGGQAPVLFLANDVSKAQWGRYAYSVGTELATAIDANSAAGLLLAANAGPVWLLSSLPVAVGDLDAADTAALLSLDVHSLIGLTNLPEAGSAPRNVGAWVEGWTEKLAWGVHELALTVSDFCRTAPPPRWDDVPTPLTWDAAVGTWDAWACWGTGGTPPTRETAAQREAVAV